MNEAVKLSLQIAAALVAILPIAASLFLIKTVQGVAGRFGVKIPGRGLSDAAKKKGKQFADDQNAKRQIRNLDGTMKGRPNFAFGKYQRRARKEAIRSGISSEAQRSQTGYVADLAKNDENFRNKLAGGGGRLAQKVGLGASEEATNRALAGAINVQAKVEAEEVTAASAVIKHLNLDRDQTAMRELSQGRDSNGLSGSSAAVRAAAMKNVIDSHDVAGVNQLLDQAQSGAMDEKTREHFADSLLSSKEKPQYVGQSAISDIRQGTMSTGTKQDGTAMSYSETLSVNAINNNTYSVDKIANGDKDELNHIAAIAADTNNGTNNAKLSANATEAQTNKRFAGQIAKNADAVDNLSRL